MRCVNVFLTILFSYLLTSEPVLISKIASLFDMHTVLGFIAVQGMFLSVGLLSDTEWSSCGSVRYPMRHVQRVSNITTIFELSFSWDRP